MVQRTHYTAHERLTNLVIETTRYMYDGYYEVHEKNRKWFLSCNSTTTFKQEGNLWYAHTTQSCNCRSIRTIGFKINERTTTTKPSINYTFRIIISSTTTSTLMVTTIRLNYLPAPPGPPLNNYTAKPTTQPQISLIDRSKNMHQCLVTHIDTRNSLYILYDDFKYGTNRAGRDGSYRENLGISLVACRSESKCGTQLTEVGGIVPRSLAYQNSYQGNLG